ncbi:MAG: PQQ-dependent sugar dehydrogenase [Verrucomicrobia bacterium]|nr:PQQ-dependent sugar dehydrogenase [Verrucomicrobiota bacterium]
MTQKSKKPRRAIWCRRPLLALLWATTTVFASAAELPAGFVEEKVLDGINAATAIAFVPDGRILVAEQTGKLRVIKNGKALAAPLLDLTARVDSYWERGLIGVAVHPDFPRTPHLFVLYVAAQPYPHHVLSRFAMLGDTAQVDSEQILLEGDDQSKRGGKHPAGHQGGPLRFGPDGKLYVAIGEPIIPSDGECTSQKLDTLSGKILRLNSDGTIPADNPFHGQTTGKYRTIWAIGLRNPFGLAFQPETGRLFETDVGQTSFEEVNEIVCGGNYGWPLAEGMSTNAAFKNPLHAYPPVIGRSIVGATFYPRALPQMPDAIPYPPMWRGKFFFADWAARWVKALDPDAPTNVVTFAKGFNAPVAVEVAPDGSLLVLNRGTIWRDGKKFASNSGSLVRIRHVGEGGAASLTQQAPPIPNRLSETGVFTSLAELRLRDGFVPFDINAPPWQPGVRGRRWISLPPGKAIKFSAKDEWEFPSGAVIVQHYELEPAGTPFETHLMWFTGPRLVRAAAYHWTADARDAALVEDGEIVPVPGAPKRNWFSPGMEQQLNLDFVVTGFLLPVNTRQLNRGQQLENWNERGWFAPKLHDDEIVKLPRLASLEDGAAPLELRVRSYLDVNCSACHRPGGPSRGNYDARFTTPLAEQKLLHGELVAGDLGIAGAQVIVPGSLEKSALYQRLKRNDFFRMPPVSVNDEAQPALPVLAEWIRQLKAQ